MKLEYRDTNGNIREVSDSDEAYFDGAFRRETGRSFRLFPSCFELMLAFYCISTGSIRQDIPVNGLAGKVSC